MPQRRKKQHISLSPKIPEFTGSLDARVPAERIKLSHQLDGDGRWFAASESSDGRYFFGTGATEPIARRAAGLRTFSHLQSRAGGRSSDLTNEEIQAARRELLEELDLLERAVVGYNGEFPASAPRKIILIQLSMARQVVQESGERDVLTRWVGPTLLFIAGAFAEGIIGSYAQKGLDILTKLVSS